MQLVDTHAHIYLEAFDQDRETLLQECRQIGLNKIFLPNIDLTSVDVLHELADAEPEMCIPMMGLHPCSVGEDFEDVLAQLRPLFDQRTYSAVGEIGIDLYWDKETFAVATTGFPNANRMGQGIGPTHCYSRARCLRCHF